MKKLLLLIVLFTLGCKPVILDKQYSDLVDHSTALSQKFTDPNMTCEQRQEALILNSKWWKHLQEAAK